MSRPVEIGSGAKYKRDECVRVRVCVRFFEVFKWSTKNGGAISAVYEWWNGYFGAVCGYRGVRFFFYHPKIVYRCNKLLHII